MVFKRIPENRKVQLHKETIVSEPKIVAAYLKYRALQNCYTSKNNLVGICICMCSRDQFETIIVSIRNPEPPPRLRKGDRLTKPNYRPGYKYPEWASGIRVPKIIRNYMSVADN